VSLQPVLQVPEQSPVQASAQVFLHSPEQLLVQPVQTLEQVPEQVVSQLPTQLVQPSAQLEVQALVHPNTQLGQIPSACAAFGLIIPRPKKAAADPASAFLEESSINLRRVTFLFSFSMIISFTLGHEKPI
jgi:hypothetical protein